MHDRARRCRHAGTRSPGAGRHARERGTDRPPGCARGSCRASSGRTIRLAQSAKTRDPPLATRVARSPGCDVGETICTSVRSGIAYLASRTNAAHPRMRAASQLSAGRASSAATRCARAVHRPRSTSSRPPLAIRLPASAATSLSASTMPSRTTGRTSSDAQNADLVHGHERSHVEIVLPASSRAAASSCGLKQCACAISHEKARTGSRRRHRDRRHRGAIGTRQQAQRRKRVRSRATRSPPGRRGDCSASKKALLRGRSRMSNGSRRERNGCSGWSRRAANRRPTAGSRADSVRTRSSICRSRTRRRIRPRRTAIREALA